MCNLCIHSSELWLNVKYGPHIYCEVFHGDTMSPIIFILAFNPLLCLAEVLNHGHGFCFQLIVPNSHNYPPVNA